MKRLLLSIALLLPLCLQAQRSKWVEHTVPVRGILSGGAFANEQVGWAIGPQTVVATRDGGRSWREQRLPLLDAHWLTDIEALSDRVAIITAAGYGRNEAGMVVRTEDSGQTWTKLALRRGVFSSIAFHPDKRRGYLVSSTQGLMRSDDYGLSWTSVRLPGPLNLLNGKHLNIVSLPDEQTVWVAGRNGLWRSDDGGQNWHWAPLPTSMVSIDTEIRRISFSTSELGWALAGANTLETRDGGKTWRSLSVSGQPYAVSPQRAWIIGNLQAWQTYDSGQSWVPLLDLDQRRGRLIGFAATPTRAFVLGGAQAIRQPYMAEHPMGATSAPAQDVAVGVRLKSTGPGFVGVQLLDNSNRVVQALGDVPTTGDEAVIPWNLSTMDDLWRDHPRLSGGLLPEAPTKNRSAKSGRYVARSIWRPPFELRYRGSFLPLKEHGMPWLTDDRTGGWVGDVKPAATIAAASNGMWIGAYAKKGDALIQCDQTMEKVWGTPRISLACPRVLTVDGEFLYFLDHGLAENNLVLVQVNIVTRQVRRVRVLGQPADRKPQISGIAVVQSRLYLADRLHNQIIVCSLDSSLTKSADQLTPIAKLGRDMSHIASVISTFPVRRPGRIRVDGDRHLLIVSDDRVVRLQRGTGATEVVASGLVNPLGLAVAGDGSFYVGEMAPQHQVKMFTRDGRMIRTFGLIGPHRIGQFDRNNLESPAGLAIAANGLLWVCEANDELRRVSVWDASGQCVRQVIGPAMYGGGGSIDPRDPDRFFYQGKEFRRNANGGSVELTRILWRRSGLDYDSFAQPRAFQTGGDAPAYPTYSNNELFFSQWGGFGVGDVNTLWRYVDEHLRPVAGVGVVPDWLRQRLSIPPDRTMFAWTDRNRDGRVQAPEVTTGTLQKPNCVWGARFSPSFEIAFSTLTGPLGIATFQVRGTTPEGNPLFSIPESITYLRGVTLPQTQQVQSIMMDSLGQPVVCGPYIYGATRNGALRWRYPNRWPSLFDSLQTSASGAEPGMLIGGMRFMGSAPLDNNVGDVLCLGTNFGSAHLLSSDGIYVGQLFRDVRRGRSWTFNSLPTSSDLNGTSLGQEHFGGTLQRVLDGQGRPRYLMVVSGAGGTCSVVELANLSQARRLPDTALAVFEEQAAVVRQQSERRKPAPRTKPYLQVRKQSVHVDGRLTEWREPAHVGLRLCYDDRFLYIGYERSFGFPGFDNASTDGDHYECFRRGNAIDLQFATDQLADPRRPGPAAGDRRLLICRVGKALRAMLYEYRREDAMPLSTVHFPSYWRNETVDEVRFIEGATFAESSSGAYRLEAAIPLQALGLEPGRHPRVQGDFGVILGDQAGQRSIERVYWSNTDTKMLSDLATEVAIQPSRWGTLHFVAR